MNRRNGLGTSWWAEQWQSVLESFGWSSRLQRGRRYALERRVQSVEVDKGYVLAQVSGGQSKPYQVTIRMQPLTVPEWSRVIEKLRLRPAFMAKLLAGEMPRDIDEAFLDVKLSLFPLSASDLETACSCPDWANPCKHIAAVYYTLGQRFDVNPFMIFTLRGMSKSEILARLREHRADADVVEEDNASHEDCGQPVSTGVSTAELQLKSVSKGNFWEMGAEGAGIELHLFDHHAVPRTLPMVWGPPHFIDSLSPKAGREVISLMADILQTASLKAKQTISDSENEKG